jgi:uncharacterized protein (DUF362 family)
MSDLATVLPCRRPELVARPFGESGSYLVRDRLQGESFQLGPEEHFLLARLDGTRTAADLCAAFTERFGGPFTQEDLQEFLDLARERGLLLPDSMSAPATPGASMGPHAGAWGLGEHDNPGHHQAIPSRSRRWAALLKRPAVRFLGGVMAVLQWLGNLLGAVGGKLQWIRLRYLEFVPRPDDIFIVTYSRSGTTWMQMILYQLTTDGNMDFPHIYEYCPWFEASLRSAGGFEGRPSPRLFKSHLPYRRIPKGPCKYIYVARNGKDVAVSYFHYHRTHKGYQGTFTEFFDQFLAGKIPPGSWFQHVRGWWRHRRDPNVLFLRYEDLLGDLEGSVRKIVAFCGFEIPPERMPTILARCGFPFMKQHESQFDPVTGELWEQGLQPNSFIRTGRTGDWKRELDPEQAARFDRVFQDQLGPWGVHFGPDGRTPRPEIPDSGCSRESPASDPGHDETGAPGPDIPMRESGDQSPLELVASQAHDDGGWGYTAGQAPDLEPTCLALLALSLQPGCFGAVRDRGLAFLDHCAAPDGMYRPVRGRAEAAWPTALVLLVQAVLGRPASDVRRTASALLELRGQSAPDGESPEVQDIDPTLTGWPWAEGNFSWVEPTAWACLALRHAGHGGHPRVEEGLRLLLDRAYDEGGLNYGNRRVLGRATEPMPGPTAIMLLALQGHGQQPRVAAAVAYLLRQAATTEDLELLCWARLALDLHRQQPGVRDALSELGERIRKARAARADTPWVRAAPRLYALTALALASESRNPFLLPAASCPVPLTDTTAAESRPPAALRSRRQALGKPGASTTQPWAVKWGRPLRPLRSRTAVHIARAGDYHDDLAAVIRRQYEAFRLRVPLAGKRVVLKPNLVEYHRDKVINTHPNVIAAVIELCQREGAAEVVVAEGPGHCRQVEDLVRACGLGDVLRHYRVAFLDLNHDEPVKMPNRGRLTGLGHLYLARGIVEADVLISLPKLKTHHWAGATLSLKNLFGTLPGICYGWPKNELHWRGIDQSIVDIALTRPPDLALVDGIVGMEGDGPLNGTPKALGALVMGCDPLAVDATCCRLMQLDPEKVAYLVLGHRRHLGRLYAARIEQIGEGIDAVAQPFETAPDFHQLCLGWDLLDGDEERGEGGLPGRSSRRDPRGCVETSRR